jgi:hypothetical protein
MKAVIYSIDEPGPGIAGPVTLAGFDGKNAGPCNAGRAYEGKLDGDATSSRATLGRREEEFG